MNEHVPSFRDNATGRCIWNFSSFATTWSFRRSVILADSFEKRGGPVHAWTLVSVSAGEGASALSAVLLAAQLRFHKAYLWKPAFEGWGSFLD